MLRPKRRKVKATPKIKSPKDCKNSKTLPFFLQPSPKSQWGIMSTRGWEIATKGIPTAGFETEAAMAPPINACVVAVTTIQYTPFVNLIAMWTLW